MAVCSFLRLLCRLLACDSTAVLSTWLKWRINSLAGEKRLHNGMSEIAKKLAHGEVLEFCENRIRNNNNKKQRPMVEANI